MPYELTDEQRDRYRATSIRSQLRKQELLRNHQKNSIDVGLRLGERLDPNDLMPELEVNGLSCLSLFAGGGADWTLVSSALASAIQPRLRFWTSVAIPCAPTGLNGMCVPV